MLVRGTDAANYTDGSQNPLIVLDNIEVKQMTEDLTTFLLTSITGIAKEKRKSGTDTETGIERTKCLLNTTGIEPLGGELAEILSRSFIVRFDMDEQASDCFLEATVLAAIGEHRDLIVSDLIRRTGRVLTLLRDGVQEKVMRLLHHTLGNHGKRRCNDYLSLIYLMLLAGEPADVIDQALEELHPRMEDIMAQQKTFISNKEVRKIVERQLRGKLRTSYKLKWSDKKYYCLSVAEAKDIIRYSSVDKNQWTKEEFDCDDFAYVLKTDFALAAYEDGIRRPPHCFGIVFGKTSKKSRHAMNWMINDDKKLRFVEPQSDKIYLHKKKKICDISLMLI